MNSTLQRMLLPMLAAIAVAGCDKQIVPSKTETRKPAPETVIVLPQVAPNYAPGESAVRAFFDAWSNRDYEAMFARAIHSGKSVDRLVACMLESPIRWRNLTVTGEQAAGDELRVFLSVEVTDLDSAFAACLLNVERQVLFDCHPLHFRLSPSDLGIERWTTVRQTWRLLRTGDTWLIDLRAEGGSKALPENVMNYVMRAARLGAVGVLIPDAHTDEEKQYNICFVLAGWLMGTCENLGIPEDVSARSDRVQPLIERARANLERLDEGERAFWKDHPRN